MGCTTALAVAERGADVDLLERAVPGAEASSAAAGILGAQSELNGREEDVALFLRAREAWGTWAPELCENSGVDVGYRKSGALRVCRTDSQRDEIAAEVSWQSTRGL